MTSKQAMLSGARRALVSLLLICSLALHACTRRAELVSPYPARQVWAVAPLRNDSGTAHADGVRLADHVSRQLGQVPGIETLPVNRVLAAMQAMDIAELTDRDQAIALRRRLGVDALVAGAVTAYDPYNPPKLGISLELYADPTAGRRDPTIDPRQLSQAATGNDVLPSADLQRPDQPVVSISLFLDGHSDRVRQRIQTYAERRGRGEDDPFAFRLYLLSMDLFSEFAAHEAGSRLILAETLRQAPPPPSPQAANANPS